MTIKIVSLDIETLSTKTSALVLEIGMISGTINSYSDIDLSVILEVATSDSPVLDNPCAWTAKVLPVSYTEQVDICRSEDDSTWAFHRTTPVREVHLTKMLKDAEGTLDTIFDSLEKVSAFCEGADEIWINGLSFDPAILKSLSEEVFYDTPLWPFRAERDVRTIYRVFAVDTDVSNFTSHQAIMDCIRNLATVRALGDHLEAQTLTLRPVPIPANVSSAP